MMHALTVSFSSHTSTRSVDATARMACILFTQVLKLILISADCTMRLKQALKLDQLNISTFDNMTVARRPYGRAVSYTIAYAMVYP